MSGERSRKKSFPRNLMSDEISLSIEETNELRRKLGLKPLQISTETVKNSKPDHINTTVNPSKRQLEKDADEGKRLFQELSGGGGILDLFDDAKPSDPSGGTSPKKQRTDSSENEDSSASATNNSSDSSDSE